MYYQTCNSNILYTIQLTEFKTCILLLIHEYINQLYEWNNAYQTLIHLSSTFIIITRIKIHLLEQKWKLYIKAILVMKYIHVPKYITVSGYKKECPETNKVNTQSITRFFKVIY